MGQETRRNNTKRTPPRYFTANDFWHLGNDYDEALEIARQHNTYPTGDDISHRNDICENVKKWKYRVPK